MAKEYETKVLDIDVEEIKKKLKELGAKEEAELFFRRLVFDQGSDPSAKESDWIRLRTDGKKTTLTHKSRKGFGIDETDEHEVEVSDFDTTAKIFSNIKFKKQIYQENKRTIFRLEDLEFSIDTWPGIPTYLEIEAPSIERVKEGLRMLGLEGKEFGNAPVYHIYAKHGIDLHAIDKLRFQ
jgi:adenylate cyclase class 2